MIAPPENSFPKEKTIGILGGGQLGRMLAMAAGRLGYTTIVLDPVKNCPAAQFSNRQIVAGYDDQNALQQLADACSFITYEFENIPVSSVRILDKICPVFPDANALKTSQDRLVEKRFINAAGMKTAGFVPVSSRSELASAINTLGLPAIMKTRRLGYDGKGQIGITNETIDSADIDAMLDKDCILEAMIDFDCEISVIGARNTQSQAICYDCAQNTHIDGMLVRSVVPCSLSKELADMAKNQTVALMESLNYVGVMGVEFFVTKPGELLINEFAPRVHNSGHWTEAACLISQFEQHIRAITGLPLGSTTRHSDCIMNNLVGEDIAQIGKLAMNPDILINDYGKSEIRCGRKMGHYTTILPITDPIPV